MSVLAPAGLYSNSFMNTSISPKEGIETMVCDLKKHGRSYLDNFFFIICIPLYRSGDSTARIWTIASVQNEPANVAVLKHYKGRANEKSKDVTTLDWNVSFSQFLVENCGRTLSHFVFAKVFTIL